MMLFAHFNFFLFPCALATELKLGDEEDLATDVLFAEDGVTLKAASLTRLVEYVTHHSKPNAADMRAFLCTLAPSEIYRARQFLNKKEMWRGDTERG
jgi:hypothetical protein